MSGFDPTPLIRDIPDWPKPGVLFKDITPLLASPEGFAATVDRIAAAGVDADGALVVDSVAGIEARGFILAAPVALRLGVGFVPIRKHGKLPHTTHAASYALEYGTEEVEVHVDAFKPGERVLLVDDVLATGGTLGAAIELIERCGAVVAGIVALIEIDFLAGRERLTEYRLDSVVHC